MIRIVIAVAILFAASLSPAKSATITKFKAVANVSTVRAQIGDQVVRPDAGTPYTATADFTLTETGIDEQATLAYTISLQGADLDGSLTDATNDDINAIHLHDLSAETFNTARTPHVLNIFGNPRGGDDADMTFSVATQTVTGLWNAGDETPLEMMAPTQKLSDTLDKLRNGEIYLMIHTAGGPQALGFATIGGFVRQVPEPSSVLLLLAAVACLMKRSR